MRGRPPCAREGGLGGAQPGGAGATASLRPELWGSQARRQGHRSAVRTPSRRTRGAPRRQGPPEAHHSVEAPRRRHRTPQQPQDGAGSSPTPSVGGGPATDLNKRVPEPEVSEISSHQGAVHSQTPPPPQSSSRLAVREALKKQMTHGNGKHHHFLRAVTAGRLLGKTRKYQISPLQYTFPS